MKTLFVAGIRDASKSDLERLFAPYGDAVRVAVVVDRQTGKPRGIAFVDLPEDAADRALRELNGAPWGDCILRLDVARPRTRETT
jgi:RNA recognition motif-containing protein